MSQIDIKPQCDMRCYNDILKTIPEENITLATIIHAMAEQVLKYETELTSLHVWCYVLYTGISNCQ